MSAQELDNIIQKLDEISWSYYFQIRAMRSIIKEIFSAPNKRYSHENDSNDSSNKRSDKTEVNKEQRIQELIRKAKTKSLTWGELNRLYTYLSETNNLDMIQTLPSELKNALEEIHTHRIRMEEAFKPYFEMANSLTRIVSPIIDIATKMRKRTEQEKHRIVLRSMLIQSIALWESMLKDYLRVLLYYDPRPLIGLKKEKMFSISEIIVAEEEYPDIRSMVIEKYVESIFFGKNIDEVSNELSSRGIIHLEPFPQWEALREAYYHRNLFAHNNGKINKIYCEKLGINDCPVGKDIELTPEYLERLLDVLDEFLEFIYENNYVVRKLQREYLGGESHG